MSIIINEIPSTVKDISQEIMKLVDGMKTGEASAEDAVSAVTKWKKFVPSLLCGEDGGLNPGVAKIIGKRRSAVIQSIFNTLG